MFFAVSRNACCSSPEDTTDLIRNALQHIQNHKLLSFPSVVNILKNSVSLKFGDVKVCVFTVNPRLLGLPP